VCSSCSWPEIKTRSNEQLGGKGLKFRLRFDSKQKNVSQVHDWEALFDEVDSKKDLYDAVSLLARFVSR
jgi:hypothetical protein